MADRFISMDEVLDRVSFSKTHIYRKIANGSFPRPVQLAPTRSPSWSGKSTNGSSIAWRLATLVRAEPNAPNVLALLRLAR